MCAPFPLAHRFHNWPMNFPCLGSTIGRGHKRHHAWASGIWEARCPGLQLDPSPSFGELEHFKTCSATSKMLAYASMLSWTKPSVAFAASTWASRLEQAKKPETMHHVCTPFWSDIHAIFAVKCHLLVIDVLGAGTRWQQGAQPLSTFK